MLKVLFELKNIQSKNVAPLNFDELKELLQTNKVTFDQIESEGDALAVIFNSPAEAKDAYTKLDNKEHRGSAITIQPSYKYINMRGQGDKQYSQDIRGSDNSRSTPHSRNREQRGNRGAERDSDDEYASKDKRRGYRGESPNPKPEQYPCRILIPTEMIKVVLGKGGSTISSIQNSTNTKIDIHRDKGPSRGRPPDDTLATIKGANEEFSKAVREIMSVVDEELQKQDYEDQRTLQLKLLAHDSLCGRIIGKNGHNLKQVRSETGARLIISNSIYDDFSPYGQLSSNSGERVITIEGSLDSITQAEEIVSKRLRQYLERDMKNMQAQGGMMNQPSGYGPQYGNNPYPMGGPMGYQRGPYPQFPPQMGYNQGGAGGYGGPYGGGGYPGMNFGILGSGAYPPMTQLVPQPQSNPNDKVETSSVIIPTKEVGAVIGRKGEYISRMKHYSGAQVRVIKGEEGGDSRVEIIGTPDSQWKASLCVFSKIKEGMKVPYTEAQLKTEFLVPAHCVGRIIGKKGQVVQEIQEKSQTDIEVPKDKQGGEDVPVFITGTFNGTQMCLNRVRDIVQRAVGKDDRS